jgi:hypothetical protein
LKAAAMRNAIEAESWGKSGMLLWAKSGGVLIGWALVVIVMTAWSAYLWNEAPKIKDRYDALTQAYQDEASQLELIKKHHVSMIEDAAGAVWIRVDPRVKPQRREDGMLWLMAEGKARP